MNFIQTATNGQGGLRLLWELKKYGDTSTTDQIFCICLILENKWKYNGTVHYLFIDFKKAY
jgi:hypothetical protein